MPWPMHGADRGLYELVRNVDNLDDVRVLVIYYCEDLFEISSCWHDWPFPQILDVTGSRCLYAYA